MKYDILGTETIEKIWNTFQNHTCHINKKYEKFKTIKNNASDRDRFVGKFFKKYVGKYFTMINKEIIGYISENKNFFPSNPTSVYKEYKNKNQNQYFNIQPVYRNSKTYLCISSFEAVNEMYGQGYIRMCCYDFLGNSFDIVLDITTLKNIQFKEINKDDFVRVAKLFFDDRDDIPFEVTRFLDEKEIKERKIKKKFLVKETVTVMAKDYTEAFAKTKNAIDIKRYSSGITLIELLKILPVLFGVSTAVAKILF